MTSIITTIETDLSHVATEVENGAIAIGKEALTILKSVGASAWTQLVTLLKESHIGTEVANMISAVQADGGNLEAEIATIITSTTAMIVEFSKNGGILAEIEKEAVSIATSLVNLIVNDFKANTLVGPLINLVTAVA